MHDLLASLRPVYIVTAKEREYVKDEQALALIWTWLCNSSNTNWLLIFDNYDEPDEFSINDYIPNSGHGAVIITTR